MLFLLLFSFGYENLTETVDVSFLKWKTQGEVPLPLVLLIAYIAGAVTTLLFAVVREIKLISEMRKIRNENKALEKEMRDIRNLQLEEDEEK